MMRWDAALPRSIPQPVSIADLVTVFLRKRPEHGYAHKKLSAICAPHAPEFTLDAAKWASELAAVKEAEERAKRGKQ
jgi:hypothetical protein